MKATRISLLLLVLGLFTSAWSEDRRVNQEDRMTVAQRTKLQRERSRTNVPQRTVTAGMTNDRTRGTLTSAVPLPQGIAAGTYLVVDNFGRTHTRVVNPVAAAATNRDRVRSRFSEDQYTVKLGASRWHFIRLDVPSSSSTATAPTPVRAASLR